MRAAALALLTVLPLSAQFSGLTTTFDGSEAWFSTGLSRKGTGEPAQGRIYRVGARGLELFAAREAVQPELPPLPSGPYFTNYYSLSHPEVSRDGRVVAFTGSRNCRGGHACVGVNYNETTVAGVPGKGEIRLEGRGRLSGNGRFLYLSDSGSLLEFPPAVVDLSTGERFTAQTLAQPDPDGTGPVVADDGSVVFSVYRQQLHLMKGGRVELLLSAWGTPDSELAITEQPVIDAAARVVLYAATPRTSDFRMIRIFRRAERRDAVFIRGNGDSYAPLISADGTRVVFISTAQFGTSDPPGLPQLYIVNIDGTGFRRASFDPNGVLEAVLSADGRVAWYVSGAGQLMRLDVESGRASETVGRTPLLGYLARTVPGSATTLSGVGFSGASVKVNGVPAPLLAVNPTSMVFQLPWETPAGVEADLEVDTLSASPFETALQTKVIPEAALPSFVRVPGELVYGQPKVLAVHEKWDALVAPGNPAHPGEIIHLYGTGFGGVEPAVETGAPGPADPPARTVTPVTCFTYGTDNQRIDVPVLFAGLAPGVVGYYQLSVRLPAGAVREAFSFSCAGGGDAGGGWLPVKY